LDAAREAGDRYGEAITLDNLGIAYRHLFDLSRSEEHFSAALTAFRQVDDKLGQARAANGLGVVHLFGHRTDDAVASFELALDLVRDLDHPDHQAFTAYFTRNLGWALTEHGDLERAEPLLSQSAAALRDLGERLEQAEALILLATVYRSSDRIGLAREMAEQALAIAGECDGTLFEALGLLELGRIELARHEATEAVGYLQQAAALFWRVGRPDLQAAAWDGTGEAYLMLGRAEDAADFFRRAAATYRERGDRWQLALVLTKLANALVLGGELGEAQQRRSEALRLLAGFTDPMAAAKRAALEEGLT
jgi:tetratricopeptide (TPR) repeat protein